MLRNLDRGHDEIEFIIYRGILIVLLIVEWYWFRIWGEGWRQTTLTGRDEIYIDVTDGNGG